MMNPLRSITTRRTTLLLGLASLSVTACSGGEHPADPVLVRDSAGVAVVENDLTRLDATCAVSPEPAVVIGSADGGPEYELYRVFGASRLSDGRIVLVNQGSQQLRYYDADGRYLASAGRAGQGPGEFRDAFYLWVLPGDTIWVGDYRPWQFVVFGPDGEWLRTVQPRPPYANPPDVISVLDDGRSVLAERSLPREGGAGFEVRRITVVVHGPDGALTDTIGTYPNGRWGRISDDPQAMGLYPLFESFSRIEAAGARVVIGHTSEAELSLLDATDGFRLGRIVRWTAGPRSISRADVEAERRRIVEPWEDMDPAQRRMLVDPLVSEERPIADQFPAFASLRLGRDGRVWIREYPRPNGPDPQWLAFDADGRFACRASLPPVDQVLEFGADYLLALIRDELGVEHVAQHAISPAHEGR